VVPKLALEDLPSETFSDVDVFRGMATIRDKMGHCGVQQFQTPNYERTFCLSRFTFETRRPRNFPIGGQPS